MAGLIDLLPTGCKVIWEKSLLEGQRGLSAVGDSAFERVEQRELRRRSVPLDQTAQVDGERPAVVGILPGEEQFARPLADLGRRQDTAMPDVQLNRRR